MSSRRWRFPARPGEGRVRQTSSNTRVIHADQPRISSLVGAIISKGKTRSTDSGTQLPVEVLLVGSSSRRSKHTTSIPSSCSRSAADRGPRPRAEDRSWHLCMRACQVAVTFSGSLCNLTVSSARLMIIQTEAALQPTQRSSRLAARHAGVISSSDRVLLHGLRQLFHGAPGSHIGIGARRRTPAYSGRHGASAAWGRA